MDYYHPSNGFNAHYAAEYAPNDSPTETKDFQAHAFMAGYSKDKISVDAAFQYAKNTCDGFSCWGVWKDAAGNVAGSYDKEINNTKEFMVSGSYKVGNFKPQIGFAYGKSSIGEDYKTRRRQHRLQLLQTDDRHTRRRLVERKRQSEIR